MSYEFYRLASTSLVRSTVFSTLQCIYIDIVVFELLTHIQVLFTWEFCSQVPHKVGHS